VDDYLKDPVEIETRSFEMIKALTDLSGLDQQAKQIAMRLVHTCGNPEIVQSLHISNNAIEAGIQALNNQCAVLCDVEMVRNGLTGRFLQTRPLCFLNQETIPQLARSRGVSRSMCALDWWRPHMEGSIAIIGNAPTALFRLMELIEDGAPKPSLIVGIPVGFIGAAESKKYLWQHHQRLGVECITVSGRSGGSALAAGVFNTLVRLQRGLRF